MNASRVRDDLRGRGCSLLRWSTALCLAVGICCAVVAAQRAQPAVPPAAVLRHPVAAAFLDDGRTLCVANQRRGTVSLVDVRQARVRAEVKVGSHLADLAVSPDRRRVLIVDDERHELIVMAWEGGRLHLRSRVAVAPYPASLAVQPDAQRATVASLWSRRVQVVDLAASSPRILYTIRLPFAPRKQCVLPGGSHVVVADAFGGHLAVVDAAAGRLLAVHELKGHNLHGLAVSADGQQLLVTHQILNQQSPAVEEHIWRGVLIRNVAGAFPLSALGKPGANLVELEDIISLKGSGEGVGDPAGLTVLGVEQFAVALAGVNEIALVGGDDRPLQRLQVGQRPTALVQAAPGQPLFVLNTFDDSLSVVDAQRGLVVDTIALGRQPVLTPAERGEVLFFDAHLSRAGWMSCHSCHPDGHTNGLLADTSGDGSHGTPKRTLTLRGTALTDPWAWNGSMKYLQDQVEQSLMETMHAPSVSGRQINDLLSFLHTLPPPPPLEPINEDKEDRQQVERGRRIFHERNCIRCHIPPLTYSSHDLHDVGFADERGQRKFNPPSLRGVGQGYGFLHDNRAATLEEVFTKYRHKVGSGLADDDLADLLRFLRSL